MNIFQKIKRACSHGRLKMQESMIALLEWFAGLGPRNLAAVCIMIVGFGVIIYSVLIPIYNNYQNEKMLERFHAALSSSIGADGSVQTFDEDNYMGSGMSEEEYEKLTEAEKADIQKQLEKDKQLLTTMGSQQIIGILQIESLGLEYAIVEGTASANIRAAVGHISESDDLGSEGNCAIAGHRGGRYGEFFKHLDQLKEGDLIKVTDLNGETYLYSVYKNDVVKPSDWSIIKNIPDQKTLTLLTCENNGRKRLVVWAKMVQYVEDENGNEVLEKVIPKLTPTPSPTPVPTPEPTPEPTPVPTPEPSKIQDFRVVNDYFGDVVYTGRTDENGDFSLELPDGAYTIYFTDSNGNETIQTVSVGSGVTSKASDIRVYDEEGKIVYVGVTNSNGDYSLSLPSGRYTIEFTNVFKKITTQELLVP